MSDTANNPTVYQSATDVLDLFSGPRTENPDDNIKRFLRLVSLGICNDAQLNARQANFVESMINRVVCGELNKVIKNYAGIVQFAMQVATFINAAHAANFAKK